MPPPRREERQRSPSRGRDPSEDYTEESFEEESEEEEKTREHPLREEERKVKSEIPKGDICFFYYKGAHFERVIRSG